MPCYCSEKGLCKSDMETLNEIKELVTKMNGTNNSLQDQSDSMSNSTLSTFEDVDVQDLKAAILNVNSKNTEELSAIQAACDSQYTWLEQEYEYYDKADREYHEDITDLLMDNRPLKYGE